MHSPGCLQCPWPGTRGHAHAAQKACMAVRYPAAGEEQPGPTAQETLQAAAAQTLEYNRCRDCKPSPTADLVNKSAPLQPADTTSPCRPHTSPSRACSHQHHNRVHPPLMPDNVNVPELPELKISCPQPRLHERRRTKSVQPAGLSTMPAHRLRQQCASVVRSNVHPLQAYSYGSVPAGRETEQVT